ncbi:MAG: hypothetical protein KAH12_12380, partial [Anaerolineales bacterium]|nr:hypothetical protein [Anaerolineales bacterium]
AKKNIMLNFKESFLVFRGMLVRVLPELENEEMIWRFSFTLGAMAHAMMMVYGKVDNPISASLSSLDKVTQVSAENEEKMLEYLIRYTVAGLRAGCE